MINKVLFLGSKELGLDCLKALYNVNPSSINGVLTIDDSIDSRSVLEGFIEFCSSNNLDLKIANSRKESELYIIKFSPELCFVVGWYWIFPKEILNIPKFGFLGIHNSLLPKYRGGAPLVWAIINGEQEVGYSIFSFTEGMDDGDIWFQRKIKIEIKQSIGEILESISKLIVIDLKNEYSNILNNNVILTKQIENNASYCALRIPKDGKIDWNKNAYEIYNFIRAQAKPYPGAFTYLNEKKIIICKANYYEIKYMSTPGQIIKVSSKNVIVGCGNNTALEICNIEVDGVEYEARNFLKSLKYRLN